LCLTDDTDLHSLVTTVQFDKGSFIVFMKNSRPA
jgi:hypothetical protein